MKANRQLAEDLGVSERHFYRLLKTGDPHAISLWRDNYVMSEFADLMLLCDCQNRVARDLEKGAPEQFSLIRNCTVSLMNWAFGKDGSRFEAKLREIASRKIDA